jgi:hypothetical protein
VFQKQACQLEVVNMADVNSDNDNLNSNVGCNGDSSEKDVNNPFQSDLQS